ncbi:ABC transporter permease [Saccharicrinis sp. FJH54]|uniref:ABC transporter permease n=1 Tax=Saccharicrinis sp. FJH54 TaxID=3344665 RepID=UPI0035D4C52A
MKSAMDINIFRLLAGFLILILPIAFLLYYRIKLVKSTLIAALRMVIQLSLVAVYLEWVFDKNSAWLNSLWVFIMIFVGVFTTIKRASLNWKRFVVPLFISALTSLIIIDTFFLGFVIKLDYVFDAQYFIPITGMVIGNALRHNIVGLRTYFKELSEKAGLYQFLLTNTGNIQLSLRPFVAEAVKQALNPLVATMSVIGLISLPGMMTGQILGGSSPAVAIKYQIMIMLAIFTGCSINLFLGIMFSKRFVFDEYNNLKSDEVFSKRSSKNHSD